MVWIVEYLFERNAFGFGLMNIFLHCQKLAHEHTSLVMSVFGFHVVVMTTATIGHEPNESLSDQMDYLIAPLDFSEVTSGLLLDRGFGMMNVEDFDDSSTSDTLFQYGDWFRYPNRLLDTVQSRIKIVAFQDSLWALMV